MMMTKYLAVLLRQPVTLATNSMQQPQPYIVNEQHYQPHGGIRYPDRHIQEVDIELYTAKKDEVSERAVEAMLEEQRLGWEKYEEYIDSENCYMITYSTALVITQTTT